MTSQQIAASLARLEQQAVFIATRARNRAEGGRLSLRTAFRKVAPADRPFATAEARRLLGIQSRADAGYLKALDVQRENAGAHR